MLAAIDAKSIDTREVEKVGRGGPSRCGSRIIGIVVGGGPNPASAPGATRQSKDRGRQRRRGDQEEEEEVAEEDSLSQLFTAEPTSGSRCVRKCDAGR